MEDMEIYFEMKASRYKGYDLTEDDWRNGTSKFGSWAAYHQAHVGAAAALLMPEDAEFVKEFMEIGITNCLHRRDELVATEESAGSDEEYHEYKGNVKEYAVELTQESNASAWSEISISEREEAPNRVILEVRVKAEEIGSRIDSHIRLAHHERVDKALEVSWKFQPRFIAALRAARGHVYVTQEGLEMARDAPGGKPLCYKFAARKHSRYCEIARGFVDYRPGANGGFNQLGVVLEELTYKSGTVDFEVLMLAQVQRCGCLNWFDTGKEADPGAEIGLTIEYGGEDTRGKAGICFRETIARTMLKGSLAWNLTWWIRLFANYLRYGARSQHLVVNPIVVKVWEEGREIGEPNPPTGPELYDGGSMDSLAQRIRLARKREAAEGGISGVEIQAGGSVAATEEGDASKSTRNKRRNRGKRRKGKRVKKYDVELRRGADGKRYRVKQEKKGTEEKGDQGV